MVRIKNGVQVRAKHKKVLKAAKGYYGARSRTFKSAANAVIKAGVYSYAHRKVRSREFRSLWIQRINAAVRMSGINYSTFIHKISSLPFAPNRKMLAELAVYHPSEFDKLVEQARGL